MTNNTTLLAKHGKINSANYLRLKKVGDIAGGFLVKAPVAIAAKVKDGKKYGPQVEYQLRQEDGTNAFFTLSSVSHRVAIEKVEEKGAKPGDLVGFELTNIVASKVKRGSKAFWIQPLVIKKAEFKKLGIKA